LLAEWDALLRDAGEDPSRRDWNGFRPLRLDREERWSDWLAHLLETAHTPVLAARLFGRDGQGRYKAPTVYRERGAGLGRADLVVRWHDGHRSHIEVKIRDPNLTKTFKMCAWLQHHIGGAKWSHFILLPEKRFEEWEQLAKRPRRPHLRHIEVQLIGWRDVAVALRQALLHENDPSWRVWACSFCGSVEQKILGHPQVKARSGSALCDVARLAMLEMSDVLEEARRAKRR
jgi:hypothetical protein